MNRACYYILAALLLFRAGSMSAQDLERELFSWLEKHSKEEIRNRLDVLKKKYPGSGVPLFIEAYIEENGERAAELYKQMVERFPDSKFTPNALLKLAQYYYAIGSYVTCRQYAVNLVDQFSESALVPEAKYLVARCLIATGDYAAAEQELKAIIKKYSQSPFKNHAKEELASLDEVAKQNKNPSPVLFEPNLEQQAETSRKDKKYAIQIGAFQDQNNASRQQKLYAEKGYLTSVETKYVSNNLLYLVWVGEFETEEQASRFGEIFKNLHGVSYRVVKK